METIIKQTARRADPGETNALSALSTIGAVFLESRLANLDIPAAIRADVTFDSCAGSGQITGTELFGFGDRALATDDAARFLNILISAPGGARIPTGKLLEGAVLALLEVRHPGWADEEGCTGTVEISWQPRGDRTTETRIGGTIGYRSLVTYTYEFWSANGELVPRDAEG